MFRSVAAVLAGLLAMLVLVTVATLATVGLMFGGAAASGGMPANPTPAYLAVNLVYSFAAAVVGGWIAARLAPNRPLVHVAALGGLMAVLSLVTLSQQQAGTSASPQPSGYLWGVAVLGILGVFLGGRLRVRGRGAGTASR